MQIFAFGIIFPTGMVLGVSFSRSAMQEKVLPDSEEFPDCPFSMACPSSDRRCHPLDRRLLPRPRAWWPPVHPQYTRIICDLADGHAYCPSRLWSLPQITPRKRHIRHAATLCCDRPWCCRESNACGQLGPDALWWNHSIGVLS